MLTRRIIYAGISHQNPKRKILTTPTSSSVLFVSSLSKAKTNNLEQKKETTLLLDPINQFIKRLILQPLRVFTGLRDKNVISATISLDRALKSYSGLNMSSSEIESKQTNDSSSRLELNNATSSTNMSSHAIESLDEPGTLDNLKEAYQEARRDADNVWLDYSHKSCYIYLYRGGGEPSETMAAFDLDGTLIKPKSNKRIPRSATDWDFFSVWTKIKLQECLRTHRSRLVIFTNQNGIGLNIVPLEEVQRRIELVTRRLDIPCSVFMAVDKNEFRKPRTGMFQLFNESFNDSIVIDRENSFYCGDAIGYPSHSDADIKFAQQLELPFLTPEKFLRGVKPKLVPTSGT